MFEERITMSSTQVVSPPRTPILKSLTGPFLIFLLAVYFYVLAGSIDAPPSLEHLGAAFWPRMILILLMISCGIKAWEIIKARGKEEKKIPGEGPPAGVNIPKLAAMIAMVILVVFLLDVIGFALANFLFLLLFMRIAGLRKKIPLFLTSALGTVFLIYLFVKVVYLPLPKGQWFFDDITIMLYRFLHII
jgi:putative tricarboxylic transport membrane protein